MFGRNKRVKKYFSTENPLPTVSVQFSCSVVSDSLKPHGLQHTRLPCPSPTPRTYSHSCPLNWWCHSTNSSSVIPFSSHLQSFPASGSFLMSQFFALGSQSTGFSASASVLPTNIQDWSAYRMDWLDLPVVQGTLKSLLQHHSSKASILWRSAFFMVQLSHPYMTIGKTTDIKLAPSFSTCKKPGQLANKTGQIKLYIDR